ncbi:hypothetical protein CWB77_13235 [Pseudoalteromonas sp. S1610]|nr:hypothetical protein CWB77_13235 [Pseudoalteromonas sp. S1610]
MTHNYGATMKRLIEDKKVKTRLSFREWRSFNIQLKRLKRNLKKEADCKATEIVQQEIELILKILGINGQA